MARLHIMENKSPIAEIGIKIRAERKRLTVSTIDAATAARLSRATLHRIECGAENVAIGLYADALAALGLELVVQTKRQITEQSPQIPHDADKGKHRRLQVVRFKDCPELGRIAWHAPGIDELPAKDALALYERNWRYVDQKALGKSEIKTIRQLTQEYGNGVFLV